MRRNYGKYDTSCKNNPFRFWLPEKDAIFNETREEFFAPLVWEDAEKGAGGGGRDRQNSRRCRLSVSRFCPPL